MLVVSGSEHAEAGVLDGGTAALRRCRLLVQVAVDGRSADPQHFGNLSYGVLLLFVQPTGHRCLLRCQHRLPAPHPSSGTGGAQPACVRSRMRSRSNSAKAQKRWNTSLPPYVVVSMDSWAERNPTPRSSRPLTVSTR